MFEDLTLSNLPGAEEQFQVELAKVLKNIEDESVKPDTVREVNIKIAFKPNGDNIITVVGVNSKLAPQTPIGSSVHIGRGKGKSKMVVASFEQSALFGETDGDNVAEFKASKTTGGFQ